MYNQTIIYRTHSDYSMLGIEKISDIQDQEAKKEKPDVNKLALANLQMLDLAFRRMPACFCVQRAKNTAEAQISRMTNAKSRKRGMAIVKKLMQAE